MNEVQVLTLLFAAVCSALSVALCASEIHHQNQQIAARKRKECEQLEAERLEAEARRKEKPGGVSCREYLES